MADDIRAQLAGARTDSEAREAIKAALDSLWPAVTDESDPWSECVNLLNGPVAGWLGVGYLMAGSYWALDPAEDRNGAATGEWSAYGSDGRWVDAKRPDCALVLAALSSLPSNKTDA